MKVIFLERCCDTLTKKFLAIACIYLTLQAVIRTLDFSSESTELNNDVMRKDFHNQTWNNTSKHKRAKNKMMPTVEKVNDTDFLFANQKKTLELRIRAMHEENTALLIILFDNSVIIRSFKNRTSTFFNHGL